jgi:membrane protein
VVLVFWRVVRWAIALLTSVSVLGALYHYGTRRTEDWAKVAPGAIASALGWFAATLVFGFYVTRIANYTMFYGSFGAGIATLVWIYISAFCALMGAELNAILFRERRHEASAQHDSYDPSL